jgi:NitT/TauT family transport system substrate-binding protein
MVYSMSLKLDQLKGLRSSFCSCMSTIMRVLFAFILITMPGVRYAAAQSENLPVIRVGTSNIDASAIIYFAKDRGFFRKVGIRVQIEPGTNGAAAAAAVLSGTQDVGVSNVTSIAIAHTKHLPLVFIAPSALYSENAPTSALMVPMTSSIESGADLNGKTVAVDGLNNVTQIAADGWIDMHGGNSRTVHFVELPFSVMGSALERHAIDAAVIVEPALTLAKAYARDIGSPYSSIGKRFLINGWFADSSWIARNPDIVRRFADALREAAKWANSNQAESAPILVAHSKIPLRLVKHMTRARFAEVLDPVLIQPQIDAAVKYGVIANRFPAGNIMYSAVVP